MPMFMFWSWFIMFGGMPDMFIMGRSAESGVGFMALGGTIGWEPLVGQAGRGGRVTGRGNSGGELGPCCLLLLFRPFMC